MKYMKKIILPIYYEVEYKTKKNKTVLVWLNWYRNVHHFLSNKVKKHYHELVKDQVKNKKFGKIKCEYKIYIKRKNTDYHNIRSVVEKFFLDWLVSNWNIIDDSFDYMKWDKCEVFIDKENPRMEILITNIK